MQRNRRTDERPQLHGSAATPRPSRVRRMGKSELETAIQQLRIEIQKGRLVPGQRLVETDMMEHLGVTRGHVREVFKTLQTEGLIQIEKNRGASVRKISRAEVIYVAEVLENVSLLILKRIARQIEQPTVAKKLKESLHAAKQFRRELSHIAKVHDYMDENARFWGSLAAAAGNPILSDIRLRLQSLLFRFAMEGLTVSENRKKWLTWHEEIIASLLEGKTRQALHYARKSMHDVWQEILNLPDGAFGP